ncbi:hypothetical protein BH10BAC4_BH10BAC4_23570 [soil metagenome]
MIDNHLVNKPNLPRRLFWEFRYDAMDWLKESAAVIERVIERGTELEWKELIRFYGREKVVNTLKHETNYLPDEIIQDVSRYFNLNPTELKCFIRKQSLPRHWI